ncbi:helix-turn-helix domain-containing protein [Modestobacter marinus]|uniref:helix-turn-helix domain-containing protein n=1 Tax=Modestobacter marinus TaxID=477641 RepID=UPI001C93E1F0|nr:helix-turn-helix transcriptional regulator [Modestobacter marinus]
MAAEDDDPRVRQLGQYIRLQRQMADLSLRGMADLTKVSNAYLSQIERGLHQPSLRVLQAIAKALNIPPDTLLAEAGLLSKPAGPTAGPRNRTEEAIRSDPDLTAEERDALLRIYRSFVEGRSPGA